MSDRPAVGLVGPVPDGVVAAVESAGGTAVRAATTGTAAASRESGTSTAASSESGTSTADGDEAPSVESVARSSDFLVAVGEAALLAVARATPAAPVLPVAAGRGVRSVHESDAAAAVRSVLADECRIETHPLHEVTVADRTTASALLDAMLVTAQPGEISEYSVEAGDERIAQFRADGVVIASPAGSPEYARAAGGPVVPPESGVLVVVPVAAFATDVDHWVVPPAVSVTVERDESEVELLADDRTVGPVSSGERVHVAPDGAVDVAVVRESQSPFRQEIE